MTTPCTGGTCTHVMHMRCTECRREQYAPAVWAISHGEQPCPWCGRHNPVAERGAGRG